MEELLRHHALLKKELGSEREHALTLSQRASENSLRNYRSVLFSLVGKLPLEIVSTQSSEDTYKRTRYMPYTSGLDICPIQVDSIYALYKRTRYVPFTFVVLILFPFVVHSIAASWRRTSRTPY
jgi:hypothetical protein